MKYMSALKNIMRSKAASSDAPVTHPQVVQRGLKEGQGFTFFELIIVLAVLSMLSIAALPEVGREADETLRHTTISGATHIVNALLAKCGAAGPNACFDSASDYNVSALLSDGLLTDKDEVTVYNNPYYYSGGPNDYSVSIIEGTGDNPNLAKLSFGVPGKGAARIIANAMTNSYVLPPSGGYAYYTVVSIVHPPRNLAAYQHMIPIDGSKTLQGSLKFGDSFTVSLSRLTQLSASSSDTCTVIVDDNSCAGNIITMTSGLAGPEVGGTRQLAVIGALKTSGQITASSADFNGSAIATAFYYRSDENIKENIQDIEADTLDKLSALRTVKYNSSVDEADHRTHYGFIAQDVEKYFPNLVTQADDGYKAVNYQAIIPMLAAQAKSLNEQVTALEQQLVERTNELNALRLSQDNDSN